MYMPLSYRSVDYALEALVERSLIERLDPQHFSVSDIFLARGLRATPGTTRDPTRCASRTHQAPAHRSLAARLVERGSAPRVDGPDQAPQDTLVAAPHREDVMRFGRFKFGSIQIDGTTYEHDLVIDGGRIRKRKKKPSKSFRSTFGHTPLSNAEDIPWACRRLVVGTGTDGALPVMEAVKLEAQTRHVELSRVPHSAGDR